MEKLDFPVYLFISPHLDDAVFSCGGFIYRLVSAGRKVVIVTVFTADDESGQPPSRLAQRCLNGWNLGNTPFARRCLEDKEAAKLLGAEVIHLGFLDAIYRRDIVGNPLYTRKVTGVPVHDHDWRELTLPLQEKLRNIRDSYSPHPTIMAYPLGVGGHVDHQIVRSVVEAVAEPDARFAYEDFPYALSKRAALLPENACGTREMVPVTVALSPAEIKARQQAMACYASQIAGCFPSQFEVLVEILRARVPFLGKRYKYVPRLANSIQRMSNQVHEYVAFTGGERYWLCVEAQAREFMVSS